MTVTEYLTTDFLARKACGVAVLPSYEVLSCFDERRFRSRFTRHTSSLWIIFELPVGKEKSSCQVTEILHWVEPSVFIPRTILGKKLMSLRKRAIASGMRLLSEDEVLEEVKRQRGEWKNDKTDVY